MSHKVLASSISENLEGIIKEHREAVENSFTEAQLAVLEKISREILKAFMAGHKILLCGNGGSAADSQHIAAEFIARFKRDRKSLPAISLTTDTSILTAIANDYDYEKIFSRQIEGLGNKGDILIALSTSGNSKNVLAAVKQAHSQGLTVIGFTGNSGGSLQGVVDICFQAQAKKTPHIQEVHITALHAISEVVEDVLFGS
ncbi:MAG: D-sedoheptulose 7-phosphate isomerase [Candidatus Omnitrophica bacterium]|nr:D-sedoheptulose 7-phosphate isomerase [Candidatus Omnitrophota bacterium]